MFFINILVGIPLSRQKWIFLRDYLAVEERRQSRKLLGEALNLQVTAQVTVVFVDMLNVQKITTIVRYCDARIIKYIKVYKTVDNEA